LFRICFFKHIQDIFYNRHNYYCSILVVQNGSAADDVKSFITLLLKILAASSQLPFLIACSNNSIHQTGDSGLSCASKNCNA